MRSEGKAPTGLGPRLTARFGGTGLTALAAGLWAIPFCFWAGGIDFESGAIWGLYVGIALFPLWVWIAFKARGWERDLVAVEGHARLRRFELRQMSRAEKGWALGCMIAVIGLIGWLNAAATVDLGSLAPGLASGNGRVLALAEAGVLLLIALIVAARYCWVRNAAAFGRRADG